MLLLLGGQSILGGCGCEFVVVCVGVEARICGSTRSPETDLVDSRGYFEQTALHWCQHGMRHEHTGCAATRCAH